VRVFPSLPLPHRLWRALPAGPRRRVLARAAALLAPRIAQPAPIARGGVIVAGELTRASGLGESARLMLRALETLGVPAWPLDIGALLPAHRADMPPPPIPEAPPPPGAALVVHVNAPLLPLVLARLPRGLVRGRRVVGYWAWELPVVPPDWRTRRGRRRISPLARSPRWWAVGYGPCRIPWPWPLPCPPCLIAPRSDCRRTR